MDGQLLGSLLGRPPFTPFILEIPILSHVLCTPILGMCTLVYTGENVVILNIDPYASDTP